MSSSSLNVAYGAIAHCFLNNSIVPFLGSAASKVGAPKEIALPDGRKLARMLALQGRYPGADTFSDEEPYLEPLTKVSQYLQEVTADRQFILEKINDLFLKKVPNDYTTDFIRFLKAIPINLIPRLLITTNYDVLIENTLESLGMPYLAVSHIIEDTKHKGRFICYDSLSKDANILIKREIEEKLNEMEYAEGKITIIYKMHGTARFKANARITGSIDSIDSIVITESDYISFLTQDMISKVPIQIIETLKTARLVYLGYSMQDWNFRVMLQRVRDIQQKNKPKHWACLLETDIVE